MSLIVNGQRVDESLIEKEIELLRPGYEQTFKDMEPSAREAQLLEWSKENVIEKVLLQQQAKNYGGPISQQEIESTLEELGNRCGGKKALASRLDAEDDEQLRQRIELQIRVERLLADICKDLPQSLEEQIQQYYEQNKEQFRLPQRIRVAHIVKHVNFQCDETTAKREIAKAQEEFKAGSLFEQLVEKYSDCPENKGDLGYINRGQMVEEFDDVVFNLDVGEVSDIFQTRFGFHIAKVYARQGGGIAELEKIRNVVAGNIVKQSHQEAIEKYVDKLKAQASIEEV